MATCEYGETVVCGLRPRLLLVIALFGAGMAMFAGSLREPLFGRSDPLFPAFAVLVTVGAGGMGLLVGTLAGRGRFYSAAVAIAAENTIRVLLGSAVIALGWGALVYGGSLAAGALIVVAWPSVWRVHDGAFFRGLGSSGAPISSLTFLGGIAGASLLGQVVLTGGPIVLALLGGRPSDVTGLFATLAISRAPYVVAIGVSTRVSAALTSWRVTGRETSLRRANWAICAAGLWLALCGGLIGAWVGPAGVQFLFGEDVVLTNHVVGAIVAASLLALSTLAQTLMVIAHARAGLAVRTWLVAVSVAGAWATFIPLRPLEAVTSALLAAEVLAFIGLGVQIRILNRRFGQRAAGASDEGGGNWT